MRLYEVYIYALNGNTCRLNLRADDLTIATKVKQILQDNEGGTAEVFGENFYIIVDA